MQKRWQDWLWRHFAWLALATAVTSLLALVIYLPYGRQPEKSCQAARQTITEWLHPQLEQVAAQQNQLQQSIVNLRTGHRFAQLNQAGSWPSAIYANGRLYYWNTHQWMQRYPVLQGSYRYRVIWLRDLKTIMRRHAFEHNGVQFEVFTAVPLYRRFSINNQYLGENWSLKLLGELNLEAGAGTTSCQRISAPEGEVLFSLSIPEGKSPRSLPANGLPLVVLVLGLGMGLASAYILVRRFLLLHHKVGLGLAALLALLAGLRLALAALHLPQAILPLALFNRRYNQSALFDYSLGELITDLGFVLLALLLLVGWLYRWGRLVWLIKKRNAWTWAMVAFSWVVAAGAWLGFSWLLQWLLHTRAWAPVVDIAAIASYQYAAGVLGLVLMGACCFLLLHLATRMGRKVFGRHWLPAAACALPALGLLVGHALWRGSWMDTGGIWWLMLAMALAYHVIIYGQAFTKYLHQQRYETYVYLLLFALAASGIGATVMRAQTQERNLSQRRQYGQQLLEENDALGEALMQTTREQVAADPYIISQMLNPMANRQWVENKIKRAWLDPYFSRYDVEIRVFNSAGLPVNMGASRQTFEELEDEFSQRRYRTQYPGIYFLPEVDKYFFKRYVCFITLQETDGVVPGYVFIDLKLRREGPSNVFPELLRDRPQVSSVEARRFSYAIFSNKVLIYNSGSFDYMRYFNAPLLDNKELYRGGILLGGQEHLAVAADHGRVIVISSPQMGFRQVAATFSLHLFIYMTCLGGLVVASLIGRLWRNEDFTLATRIQVYLNAAFFLPLLAACVLTLSAMSTTYQQNLNLAYLRRTEEVGTSLAPAMGQYMAGRMNLKELGATINNVARTVGIDLNLYSLGGQLLHTNQPLVYERQLLAPYINPQAQAAIVEGRRRTILLTESVGSLGYKNVYIALRSGQTGQLLGTLSVPWFESNAELVAQIEEVISTLLLLFTVIFLIFLAASYYAAGQLVAPLRLITRHLRQTSFEKPNRLQWKVKDEIGLLAGEYNRMVAKLESSAEALARTNKEMAWREMARQVAHEIKNPLTPMKLSLQHLQHALRQGHPDLHGLTSRMAETLLNQVEVLNDIANSFSTLARMPVPQRALVDLARLLPEVANLFASAQERGAVALTVDIEVQPAMVQGDERLLTRIFNNLILNALQSVPEGRSPKIWLRLEQRQSGLLLASIEDNGSGIAPDLRARIFQPNFSTKTGGAGIGLAVAKAGIEYMNGRIWFETQPGKGTTFYIELPVAEDSGVLEVL